MWGPLPLPTQAGLSGWSIACPPAWVLPAGTTGLSGQALGAEGLQAAPPGATGHGPHPKGRHRKALHRPGAASVPGPGSTLPWFRQLMSLRAPQGAAGHRAQPLRGSSGTRCSETRWLRPSGLPGRKGRGVGVLSHTGCSWPSAGWCRNIGVLCPHPVNPIAVGSQAGDQHRTSPGSMEKACRRARPAVPLVNPLFLSFFSPQPASQAARHQVRDALGVLSVPAWCPGLAAPSSSPALSLLHALPCAGTARLQGHGSSLPVPKSCPQLAAGGQP